ncbi:MAG: hypothetical protein ABFC96_11840 [Thermoguttaceae bacterium]
MDTIRCIVEKISAMAPALTKVDWEPLHQDAILEFADGPECARLRLAGIQLFASRHSLLGGGAMDIPEERDVQYFDILEESAFLKKFLDGEIFSPAEMVVYDMHNRAIDERGFTKPLHVVVSCSDGILDAICEKVEFVEGEKG